MKQLKLMTILGALIIILTSQTTHSVQTDKFPPIQNYFDKTVGEKCYGVIGLDKIISQNITEHTIIIITEDVKGDKSKNVYSNLDFSKLSEVQTYKEEFGPKKIFKLVLRFNYDITYTLYKNEKQYATGKQKRLDCYILAKDENSIKKLFNEWMK